MQTQEYAPGRVADVFGDPSDATVLVWHGTQTDARATVRALANQLTAHHLGVVAPDWDSHAADAGRSDLLESVRFARERIGADTPLVLVGWSLGGVAAAGLTVHADQYDVTLTHTVCLAGAFMVRDPLSGGYVADAVTPGLVGAPFTLLHGTTDDVVPVEVSRSFAASLREADWPVDLVELDTDHGAIAGAAYDAAADRYVPTDDPLTREAVRDVAARIAATLGR